MVSQVFSALFRAFCVAALVVLPSLILPNETDDTSEIAVVIALLAALLTFMEYNGRYPSIVEFRFAPPYNRLRFIAFATCVVVLSVILRGKTDPNGLSTLLTQLGDGIGGALDFPYSPVRLVVLMLPADTDPGQVAEVRMAAGLAYAMSMALVAVFVVFVRLLNWPLSKGSFNVWINLPLFDPTRGGDVVGRLRRDAGVNIVLGILLPFIVPAVVKAASDSLDPIMLTDPQTLIWTMTAWAFIPASMLIRGIALSRVAELIEAKRKRAYARDCAEDKLQEA